MSSDRSRTSDHPRNLYAGIVAQQGRVVLDRDVNVLQESVLRQLSTDVRDIVGPCGTPDDGFKISAPNAAPNPGFFTPPTGGSVSPPQAFGEGHDFLIGAGSMYLGGQRVEFPAEQGGQTVTYSYEDQPDWVTPDRIERGPNEELVFLDVALQEVSAVEDPDLMEAALGGPDTTHRLRLIPRVKRWPVQARDCETAWQLALRAWAEEGLDFDPANMALTPALKLKVGFTQDAGTGDPCDPVATGGYLGADNQLIRVQLSTAGGDPTLVWGYDNASFLYRVATIAADGVTLTLAGGPPDDFHVPQTGQIVEILTTGSVVASEPDETDPTGKRQILRVAAEAVGEFHALAQTYGPVTQGDPTAYIVLSDAVSAEVQASPLPVFLRVWQAQLPLTIGQPVVLQDPSTGVSTGIEVTLSGAHVAADGAFWQIAARPATPQGVYPEDLLVAPQRADGPVRYVCPLAVITWSGESGPTITDCRNTFDNLVELSRRRPGCCTVSITPRDLGRGASLQQLINRAVTQGETVTVCLAAGVYPLRETLRLGCCHAGLRLESCGGPAILEMERGGTPRAFLDGLVVVTEAAGVTLSGLSLRPPLIEAPNAMVHELLARLPNANLRQEALSLLRRPHFGFGVRGFDAPQLTLERCSVAFEGSNQDSLDLIAAAVFLQGDCSDFTARDCAFESGIDPTYNAIDTKPAGFHEFIARAMTRPAAPAPPPPAAPTGATTVPAAPPPPPTELPPREIATVPASPPPVERPPAEVATVPSPPPVATGRPPAEIATVPSPPPVERPPAEVATVPPPPPVAAGRPPAEIATVPSPPPAAAPPPAEIATQPAPVALPPPPEVEVRQPSHLTLDLPTRTPPATRPAVEVAKATEVETPAAPPPPPAKPARTPAAGRTAAGNVEPVRPAPPPPPATPGKPRRPIPLRVDTLKTDTITPSDPAPASGVAQAIATDGAAEIARTRLSETVDAPAAAAAAAEIPARAMFDLSSDVAASQALSVVMANRSTSEFAARQRPLTATVGVLALSFVQRRVEERIAEAAAPPPNAPTGVSLGQAELRGNRLQNLTFGALISAELTSLRVQDNDVAGGVAGLWLSLANTVSPQGVPTGADAYYDTVQDFEEFPLLVTFASIVPPPRKPECPGHPWNRELLQPKIVRRAIGHNALFMVSGNHISTGLHPPPLTRQDAGAQSLVGSTALLLWTEQGDDPRSLLFSDISLLVTGNHLISGFARAPTALLVQPQRQSTAISGNIVLNRPTPPGTEEIGPSLWVVISNSARLTQPVAATGNVLHGASDIDQFVRGQAASRPGWSGYNADPF